MFLCAGLGTRLRPLTLELPKPLVPVGDRPILAHLVNYVRKSRGEPRIVNTHHRPEAFESFIKSEGNGMSVSYEPELLGTAGGLAAVRHHWGSVPIVVWNGDIFAQPNLSALVSACVGVAASLAVVERPVGEGTCGLDSEGRIVRLRGERFGTEQTGADYMGVFALEPSQLAYVPLRGCIVGDYFLPRLRRGDTLRGVTGHGEFSDVGTPSAYLRENLRWLGEHVKNSSNFLHPDAVVAKTVELEQCIIGAGAKITGYGRLERVVVWPGANVAASLSDAIVTRSHGILQVT
jgi:mannose-1-phosphate guanylyltransferase